MKSRYTGIKSYTENESDIFFGRKKEINDLFKTIVFEKISILHSQPNAGKTSVLRAGLISYLEKLNQFDIFYINIPMYKKSNIELSKIIEKSFGINPNSLSFLDKLVTIHDYFWYYLKKIQTLRTDNKITILIFDGFENLLTYPKTIVEKFNIDLSSTLYDAVPKNIKTEIKEKILKNPELLTEEGSELLYNPLKIRVLFSMRTKNIKNIKKFAGFYPDLEKNKIKLNLLNKQQAREIIENSSGFVSKNIDDNNFITKPYKFESQLVDNIIDFLSLDDKIKPNELQIVLKYSENLVAEKNISTIYNKDFSDFNQIFGNYYSKCIYDIKEKNIRNNLAGFVENELILESENRLLSVYNGIIKERYDLNNNIFDKTKGLIISEINENNEIYRKLSSNKFANAIINFKNERKQNNERIIEERKEAKKLQKEAEIQLKKTKKTKIISFVSIVAFIISIAVIFVVNKARNEALSNELFANSALLTAYSFQEIDKDPTKAFRYAEAAYLFDKNNPTAYSALINSYYATEAFYSIVKTIDNNTLSARLSSDGKLLLTVIRNKKDKKFIIKLEEVYGKELFRITHDKIISSIGFMSDSRKIEFSDVGGNIFLYNIKGKKLKEFKAHDFMVWRAVFSNDMKRVLTSGADRKVVLWTSDGVKISELPKHDFDVYAIDFSPDGKYIATATDSTIHICDSVGGLIKSIQLPVRNSYYFPLIQEVRFSSDSKKLLIAVNDMAKKNHVVRIIDIQGNDIMLFRGHTDWINTARFSNDNSKIITSSIDNTVRVWKIDGELIGVLKGHKSKVIDAQIIDNNKRIVSVSDDKTVRVWNFGRLLNPLKDIENIESAIFSPDGFNILTAQDSVVKYLDLTGDVEHIYSGNKKNINSIDISDDGKLIVTAGKDKTVRVWNITGEPIAVFMEHTKKVKTAVFMPDSNLIISASSDSCIILWDPYKEKLLKKFKIKSKANFAEFSPDGLTFITAEKSGDILLLDMKGQIIKRFSGHTNTVLSAKFSPDGKYIISTSKDRTVNLWQISGQLVHTFSAYNNKVNTAEFSSDGKYIVTASNDNKVKLYNLTGKEVASFNHEGKVLSAVFSQDGKYILSVISMKNKNTAKLQVIKPDKILELTNEVKIFGDFYKEDFSNIINR